MKTAGGQPGSFLYGYQACDPSIDHRNGPKKRHKKPVSMSFPFHGNRLLSVANKYIGASVKNISAIRLIYFII